MTTLEQSKDFVEKLKSLPPADWVQEILEHYQRTGGFRPRDLRRLLGSQKRNDALRNAVLDIIRSKSL